MTRVLEDRVENGHSMGTLDEHLEQQDARSDRHEAIAEVVTKASYVKSQLAGNLALIEAFWNRHTFHDEEIQSVTRINGRVIVTLSAYVLVLVGVTQYKDTVTEFPAVWLYENVTQRTGAATLTIDSDCGSVVTTFQNCRLIRRVDMSVLVPSLD